MTRAQVALTVHAVALIAAMFVLVPWLTSTFGGPAGYILTLGVYWLGFCFPVLIFHVERHYGPQLFSEKVAWRDWWIPLLLLVQVMLVGGVAFMPNTALLTTSGLWLAAGVGVLNGPLEEAAWRGGFLLRFADRPRLGFWLGWALFSAWHIPLALSHGIAFDGGWPTLVFGAAALGLLWTWIAWRTGSIFWVAIAHALTNVVTFWVLFDRNSFL
jgi:membrane protease YdiL (CAAX protease family)